MIIISRINEDISWLDIFTNKIIYNLQKMEGDTTNIITLNSNIIIHNHSHLYSLFHYIYNNYENLDEYTIFLELKDKGYPIENISFKEYLIEKIKKYMNANHCVEFEYFGRHVEILDVNNLYTSQDSAWEIIDKYSNKLLHDKNYFKELYITLFGNIDIESIQLPGDAIMFAVSKKNIYKRDKEYYFNILNMLNYAFYPYRTRENYIIQ